MHGKGPEGTSTRGRETHGQPGTGTGTASLSRSLSLSLSLFGHPAGPSANSAPRPHSCNFSTDSAPLQSPAEPTDGESLDAESWLSGYLRREIDACAIRLGPHSHVELLLPHVFTGLAVPSLWAPVIARSAHNSMTRQGERGRGTGIERNDILYEVIRCE